LIPHAVGLHFMDALALLMMWGLSRRYVFSTKHVGGSPWVYIHIYVYILGVGGMRAPARPNREIVFVFVRACVRAGERAGGSAYNFLIRLVYIINDLIIHF